MASPVLRLPLRYFFPVRGGPIISEKTPPFFRHPRTEMPRLQALGACSSEKRDRVFGIGEDILVSENETCVAWRRRSSAVAMLSYDFPCSRGREHATLSDCQRASATRCGRHCRKREAGVPQELLATLRHAQHGSRLAAKNTTRRESGLNRGVGNAPPCHSPARHSPRHIRHRRYTP